MSTTKTLQRYPEEGMIAGVCAGIARYFNWDPTWTRLGYVIISFFSAAFPGILVYLVLWLIVPRGE
jgi:phage shock protein PspC (stress-responsive transcriptional regulator)